MVATNAIGGGSARDSRSISSAPEPRPGPGRQDDLRAEADVPRSCLVDESCRPAGRVLRRAAGAGRDRRGRACVRSPPLAVVARAQVRIGEPVVGDVDPLRRCRRRRPGDVGMMALEQRPPGDLDGLGRGVGRQLEPSVEVVGREHRASHRAIAGRGPLGAPTGPKRPAAGMPPCAFSSPAARDSWDGRRSGRSSRRGTRFASSLGTRAGHGRCSRIALSRSARATPPTRLRWKGRSRDAKRSSRRRRPIATTARPRPSRRPMRRWRRARSARRCARASGWST